MSDRLLFYAPCDAAQVFSQEELELLAGLCREHNAVIIVDEVHENSVFPPNQLVRIGVLRSG